MSVQNSPLSSRAHPSTPTHFTIKFVDLHFFLGSRFHPASSHKSAVTEREQRGPFVSLIIHRFIPCHVPSLLPHTHTNTQAYHAPIGGGDLSWRGAGPSDNHLVRQTPAKTTTPGHWARETFSRLHSLFTLSSRSIDVRRESVVVVVPLAA